jgi:hypothetical protein
MPQTLAQMIRAKYPDAYTDLSDQDLETKWRAKYPGAYDDVPSTPTKPKVASGSTFSEKVASAASMLGDVGVGAAKGAARTVANLGETAVNAGMIPGQIPAAFNSEFRNPLFNKTDALTTPTSDAQKVGYYGETAAEYAQPAWELAKAATVTGKALLANETLAQALMKDTSLTKQALTAARQAIVRRVFATALTPNKGGRVAGQAAGSASALEQAISEGLADARVAAPSAPGTLPPPPEVPPGYTPRTTTGPRLVPAPSAPAPAPAAPARPYFLKSPATMELEQAVQTAAARSPAKGPVTMADLPESWKAHTGQDIFPTTGAESKEVQTAMLRELKDRGMSVGDAISAVSRNQNIPTILRTQLIRALSQSGLP